MQNEIIYQKLLEIEKLLELSYDEILDIGGACALLKTTKSSIYQLVYQRKIPCFKPNRRLYFSKLTLMKWFQEHRLKTIEELKHEMNSNSNVRFQIRRVRNNYTGLNDFK